MGWVGRSWVRKKDKLGYFSSPVPHPVPPSLDPPKITLSVKRSSIIGKLPFSILRELGTSGMDLTPALALLGLGMGRLHIRMNSTYDKCISTALDAKISCNTQPAASQANYVHYFSCDATCSACWDVKP